MKNISTIIQQAIDASFNGAVTVFCSEPKFDNCVFKENKELAIYADFDPSYCNLLNPNFIIQNCSFISNDRQSSACAAVWIQGCPNINFSDNVFVDNRGYDFGGALFLWNCSGHVTNCVFESNICRSWSVSTSYGGAVCTWCTSVRFENCLFFDNQVIGNYYPPTEADSYGGAISLDSYQVSEPNQLINCTFVDNEQWIHNGAGGHSQYGFGCGGAIYVQWGYAADIVNCVVWYNEDMFPSYNSLSDSICAGDYTVDSSWIEFHPSGIEPPQFEDYANDLFYLSSTSPLIDQGNAPADEICFDTVSGTQCLSEMTTQISGVPDTGIADIGYHYRTTPSPIPTVTPTSTATDTPTITPSPTITPTLTDTPIPTDSPTPTVTPTSTPSPTATATPLDGIMLALHLPEEPIHAGDTFYLDVNIHNANPDPLTDIPLFVILEAAGTFWYHPAWSMEPAWEMLSIIPAGPLSVPIQEAFEWPGNAGTGTARFWSALTDQEMTRVLGNYDVKDFYWE